MFYSLKKRTGRGSELDQDPPKEGLKQLFVAGVIEMHGLVCTSSKRAQDGLVPTGLWTLLTSYWDANMANIDTQETVCFGLKANGTWDVMDCALENVYVCEGGRPDIDINHLNIVRLCIM